MAVTIAPVTGTKPYTVLRAICMAGERVEVGETVELTNVQYAELFHAGKVGPLADKPKAKKPKAESKPAEAPVADAQESAPPEAPAAPTEESAE